MLKSRLTLGLVASAFLAGSALAQGAATAPPPAGAGKFDTTGWLMQERPGQWRASKLHGLNIYNLGDEKIGEIEELMVGANGGIDAVIVSVGGFLGMGEHYVAVPFKSFQFVDKDRRPLVARLNDPAPVETTSSTNKTVAVAAVPYPDRAILNATKDQLKSAPQFKYAK